MTEHVYFAPEYRGYARGTKDQPFSVPTSELLDAIMRNYSMVPGNVVAHLNDGILKTVGTREWNDTNDIFLNPGFRLKNWRVTSETGATLKWDYEKVPDSDVGDEPIALLYSWELRLDKERVNLHSPEEAWLGMARGQAVTDLDFDLSFDAAVDRYRGLGKKLRIGAIALAGHGAAVERVNVTNYGGDENEAFPIYIQAAYGMYDRNLIARTDPATHIFDSDENGEPLPDEECSHIVDANCAGFSEKSGLSQVSLRFIAGSLGERTPGEWVQHMRHYAYIRGGDSKATGPNMVQGATIYQCLRGLIEKGTVDGVVAAVYGDSYTTRGLTVRLMKGKCYHGVQLQLSDKGVCPEQCSIEDVTIDLNAFDASGYGVLLDTLEKKMPTGPTQIGRAHV